MSSPRIAALLICALAPLVLSGSGSAGELFQMSRYESPGRSVAAELADVNGDARVDLFVVLLKGLPPEEQRTIRVHLQKSDGSLPAAPDHILKLPRWSAVYDVADIRPESPGEELVLLGPTGITLLSLADASGKTWFLPVPGPTTAGLADDERGFEPFQLVFDDFGPELWILVPQIGELTALSPTGEVRARIAVPRRANYFIIPTNGLVSIETDFQFFVDVPKLSLGDVNGDGRVDFVSSTRHEIHVFHRRADGSYPYQADQKLPLRRVTPRDHIRGTGGVSSEIKDIDGDGRLDLLISAVSGGFSDAETKITIFLNHGGGWDLEHPDQTLTASASFVSNALYDLDLDGQTELVRLEFRFSVLEFVEIILSRELDIDFSILRWDRSSGFSDKPWMKKKLELPFSFDTMRLSGFIPIATVDVNSDGFLDFVWGGDGETIEVFLGNAESPFGTRSGRQKMSTAGVVHFRDFDADGLLDFVIFDPHNFDVPVRLGINRGELPGTPLAFSPQPTP